MFINIMLFYTFHGLGGIDIHFHFVVVESRLISQKYISNSVFPNFTSPISPPPSDPLPIPFLFRKEWASKRSQPNRMKQNTTGHCKKPITKARQTNPIGGKVSQEQATESEIHLLPLLVVPQKYQHSSWSIHRALGADPYRLCVMFQSL